MPVYKSNNIATSIIGSNCFNSYKINVFLNKEMWFENIEALGIEPEGGYEFVAGMDIIQQGNLIVRNNKRTTINFKRLKK